MPRPDCPALGSNKNIVWFHSAKLRRISGKAALLTVEKGDERRRSTKSAGEAVPPEESPQTTTEEFSPPGDAPAQTTRSGE